MIQNALYNGIPSIYQLLPNKYISDAYLDDVDQYHNHIRDCLNRDCIANTHRFRIVVS